MLLPAFDQRIVVNVAATLTWQPIDSDGTAAAAGGTVTVDITNAAGSAVVTGGSGSQTSTNPATYSLTAGDNDQLDWLTATWKVDGTARASTLIEVVGGYWASVATIQTQEPSLSGYTSTAVLAARWEAENEAATVASCSFVPRYRRARLSGDGTSSLLLPDGMLRSVRSVRVYTDATNYDSFTSDEVAAIPADTSGLAVRTDGSVWPHGRANIVIEYEHGYDRPPADLLRLFYGRVRWFATRGKAGLQDGTTQYQYPDGTIVTAGDELSKFWFAKLHQYGVSAPSVA